MQKTLNYLLSITKLDRSVLLNIFAYGIIGLIFIGVQGVLTNLYLIELGLDLSFIGSLTASGMLIWAILSLPAGMIGTRFGTRAAVIAGFVLVAVGLTLYLCVVQLPPPLWETGFYLTNALFYIGAPLVAVNGTPYLMGVAPEHERNASFTLLGALTAITAFFGSLMAGFLPGVLMRVSNGSLDQAGAYNAVLWIGVPAYLVSALLMFKARSAPPVIEQAYGTVEKIRPPWGLLFFLGILFAMQLMSENFMFLFYNVYLGEDLSISTNQIGTIFAVGRLIPFFISPLLPLMLNRSGAGRVMTAGYLLMAIVFLLMARIPIWQVAAAGFILISLLSNFSVISRNIFSQEIVKPRWRTTVNAVISICLALSMGVAGMVGGRIIPIIGFSGMFTIGAALALLSVLLYSTWQLKASNRVTAETPIEV